MPGILGGEDGAPCCDSIPGMTTRPMFLHIGASKTGTSALQRGLSTSRSSLAEQGVGMPLVGRPDHARTLLRPLGWVTASGFVRDPKPIRLQRVAARLLDTPGDRLLLTCEDLCEADTERIELLVKAFAEADVEPRVVLTVRGLSSVIPSEWQQFLKHRLTLDYPTFLSRVRDRQGPWARHFWLRQDVEAICRRWVDVVGRDRLDVVVTPDRTSDPHGLYRMFGDTVGFDPDRLSWPKRDVNASWGYVEAELYRRVNETLGKRLRRYERDYQPGLRWPLVRGALPRGASARIPLPPDHLGWVGEAAQAHVDYLRTSGIRVHGDLERLLPGPGSASPLPPIDEAAIARSAVETLANFSVAALHRERRAAQRPPAMRPGSVARRLSRRVARRLDR